MQYMYFSYCRSPPPHYEVHMMQLVNIQFYPVIKAENLHPHITKFLLIKEQSKTPGLASDCNSSNSRCGWFY